MRRLASLLVLTASLALAGAAPALADDAVFRVTSTADGAGSCSGTAPQFDCTTLRAAVNAANVNAGSDDVELTVPGTYSLAQELTFSDDTTLYGTSPRDITLQATAQNRVLTILSRVTVFGVTIAGGNATNGGNIFNQGSLVLIATRVTGGDASSGGAIYSTGQLEIGYSLLDHNDGGAVIESSTAGTGVEILSSTIADSTGGGALLVSGTDLTGSLADVTIGRNAGPGLQIGGGATVALTSSILADNAGGNCNAAVEDQGGNIEFGHSCGLVTGSLQDTDPGLSADLVNAGGWSDVLTIPATSPAVGFAQTCGSALDQRGFQRTSGSGRCDSGAYEQSAVGAPSLITSAPSTVAAGTPATFAFSSPGGAQFQCELSSATSAGEWAPCTSPQSYSGLAPGAYTFSVRTVDASGVPTGPTETRRFVVAAPQPQPSPTPAPTATPTPTPTPVPGKTVVAAPVSGKVLVKKPGSKGFVEVDAAQGIPLGSTVDTTHGVVQITAKDGQVAKFYDGIFKITQTKTTTDLTLTQPLDCGKAKGASAAAAAKKPKTRKLWGDGSGSFRTRGQYSSATVRGTNWLVQDSCSGTLTKVKKGVVSVQDNVRHKTILLKAGKSYVAKPRH